MSRIPRPARPRAGRGVYLIASAILLAVAVAPFALAAGEGDDALLGVRNPKGSGELRSETEIIAQNGSYGTRQSNKQEGNGGGAIYGCRSAVDNEACVKGQNIRTGRAFEFQTGGNLAGTIATKGGDDAKPFTTNATGVATGLNADEVDGQDATDIVASAAAQNRFAAVSATGTLTAQRGATAASKTATGTYSVTFAADVSKCALTATAQALAAGAVSVSPSSATIVNVQTRDPAGVATDEPFHLLATC